MVAPGSPVKKQSIKFFFGLPSRSLGVHSVSKHPPPQLDLHPQMLGLQSAPLSTKDLFDFFSCIAGQVRDMVGQQLELACD